MAQFILTVPDRYDPEWMRDLMLEIVQRLDKLERTTGDQWTPSNYTIARSFNASTATLGATNNTVATLIDDLKDRRILS